MVRRLIRGIVNRADGLPWASAPVSFALTPGTYTPTTQHPADKITVYTDLTGEFEVYLFPNESGETATKYICWLPDLQPFEFTVPIGNAAIELSVLRQGSVTPSDPQYATLVTYVDEVIEVKITEAIADIQTAIERRETLNPADSPNFQLTNLPPSPHLSKLFINGQKQLYGFDYSINGTVLQWLGYAIGSNWQIEVYY